MPLLVVVKGNQKDNNHVGGTNKHIPAPGIVVHGCPVFSLRTSAHPHCLPISAMHLLASVHSQKAVGCAAIRTLDPPKQARHGPATKYKLLCERGDEGKPTW